MTALALVTADQVSVVESIEQMTLPAAEAIEAGAPVRIDTSTGKFTNANGTTAAEARVYGIAVKSVAAGMPVTAIRRGVLDGFDLSSQAYDLAIYLHDTDGTLSDGTGDSTVDVAIGRVIPAHSQSVGSVLDKLLLVECG